MHLRDGHVSLRVVVKTKGDEGLSRELGTDIGLTSRASGTQDCLIHRNAFFLVVKAARLRSSTQMWRVFLPRPLVGLQRAALSLRVHMVCLLCATVP